MQSEATRIEGLRMLRTPAFPDSRGSFSEVFRSSWFDGLFGAEVQVNCTWSRAGVVRGLHYHLRQHDLWFPVSGLFRAACMDLRPGSRSRGTTMVRDIRGGSCEALLIPPGVAHGYSVLEDGALVYVVNAYYDGGDEHGVAWDDPSAGIDWGVEHPVLSERDRACPRLPSDGPPPGLEGT